MDSLSFIEASHIAERALLVLHDASPFDDERETLHAACDKLDATQDLIVSIAPTAQHSEFRIIAGQGPYIAPTAHGVASKVLFDRYLMFDGETIVEPDFDELARLRARMQLERALMGRHEHHDVVDSERISDDLLTKVQMKLSPLHQKLIGILWDGKVKTYDQLSRAWGADGTTDESVRKEADRLAEAMVKLPVCQGMRIDKGTRGSKKRQLIKPETTGRK